MGLPKISIITVTYNCADVLERTFQSVAEQDYPEIEHVVIDGASNDGTVEVIQCHRSDIAHFVSEPDKGLYDAMNKGLEAATGDFCFFLNSGDVFCDKNTLSLMFIQDNIRDLLYFGFVKISAKLGSWFSPWEGRNFRDDGIFLPHHQSVFYPASYCATERFDINLPTHADIMFTFRARKQCKAQFVPIMVVNSTMGGFATNLFRDLKRIKPLILELSRIDSNISGGDSSKFIWKNRLNSYLKLTICKIFGDDGLYQMYRFNSYLASIKRR